MGIFFDLTVTFKTQRIKTIIGLSAIKPAGSFLYLLD